jgi:positive regulator of sigma E activity
VRVAVSATSALGASARTYLMPVAGLLAGAGVAEIAATVLIPAAAGGGNAAGIGGIAGAVLAVLFARRLANRPGGHAAGLPSIVAIVNESRPEDHPGCVDAPGPPRVE